MALYAADSRTGELLLLPDQMSAAVVFVYRSPPSLAACSTSLRALARTLREVGVPPLTKSTDFFMELLASEAGGHTPSPYEEIESAPLHSYLTISARGIEMHRYPTFADLYQPDIDYREQLDLAAEEIVENAALAAAQPYAHQPSDRRGRQPTRRCGADGRRCRFLLRLLLRRERCHPRAGHTRRIAGHMGGWTMTKHPGTSSAFRIAGDMQKRLATLEASEGVKSVGQHEGGSLRAEGVVLTGYNGEAIRSFYSHRVEQVSPGEFSADAYMRAVWPEALWSPDSGWATLRSSRRSAARWTEMSVRRETPASRPRRSAIISTSRPATDTSPGIRRWSQPLSRSVHAAVLPGDGPVGHVRAPCGPRDRPHHLRPVPPSGTEGPRGAVRLDEVLR